MDLTSDDKDLVARTILSEAAEDGVRGMVAAAWTIKNRVRSGEFGDTARRVVLKPYAFEPWSLRRNSKNHPLNWSTESPLYKQAAYIVDNVWNDKIDDPTDGATHFFSPSSQRAFGRRDPSWSRTPELAQVGHHKFYAPEGGPVPEQDWLAKKAAGPQKSKPQAAPVEEEAADDWLAKKAGAATTKEVAKKGPSSTYTPDDEAIATGAGGFVRGIPVIGQTIDAGARRTAAVVRSLQYGTPYGEELAAVNKYAEEQQQRHPVAEAIGEPLGAMFGMALGARTIPGAPTMLGMTGPLAQRAMLGGATGGVINALDAGVRSGFNPLMMGAAGLTGTAFGAGVPYLGAGIGMGARKLLGIPTDQAAMPYLAQRAKDLGINLPEMYKSASNWGQMLYQKAGQLPFGGGKKEIGRLNSEVTRAASRTFGEDTDTITPQVARSARKRLGDNFDLAQGNMQLGHDADFSQRVNDSLYRSKTYASDEERRVHGLINEVYDQFDPNTGMMSGQSYRNLTKTKSIFDRAIKGGGNVGFEAKELRDAMDDSAMNWSHPYWSDLLKETKRQYKNLKTIEPLVTKGQPGEINPLALQGQVNKSYPNRAYSGAGDIGDIADIAQTYMRQPRDSGSPAGIKAIEFLTAHAPQAVAGLVGAGVGGYDYAKGASPLETTRDALGAMAGLGLAGRVARGFMNPAALESAVSRGIFAAPAARNALTVNPRPGYYGDQDQQQQ